MCVCVYFYFCIYYYCVCVLCVWQLASSWPAAAERNAHLVCALVHCSFPCSCLLLQQQQHCSYTALHFVTYIPVAISCGTGGFGLTFSPPHLMSCLSILCLINGGLWPIAVAQEAARPSDSVPAPETSCCLACVYCVCKHICMCICSI